jgi:hypothetical protein
MFKNVLRYFRQHYRSGYEGYLIQWSKPKKYKLKKKNFKLIKQYFDWDLRYMNKKKFDWSDESKIKWALAYLVYNTFTEKYLDVNMN